MRRLGMKQGIYLLWYPETDQQMFRVAYVGQGIIRARIQHHRGNWSRMRDRIVARRLRLTWAIVLCRRCRDGIERFLAEVLQPEVWEVWPQELPIRVTTAGLVARSGCYPKGVAPNRTPTRNGFGSRNVFAVVRTAVIAFSIHCITEFKSLLITAEMTACRNSSIGVSFVLS